MLAASQMSYAQTAPEVDSRKIIDKGIDLHDNKNYDEAIAEFKKISRNDTNYVLASTELVNTYIASGKDSAALVLCNSLLELPSSYIPNIMVFKANALDDLKRSDEAIKVYEEGMKKYPFNYSFTYEMGVLKNRQEKYKEAYDWFVKSVKVDPYHANTHYQLGMLAIKQGKLIPAMLAWQFYLTIDNSSDRAKYLVSTLEKMAKNEFEFKDVVKVDELDNQDDFSEIDALVKSKVALSNKYKSETKLNFSITKQIQLIMEKLVVVKDDKGFYMQFYAPLFLELYKKKLLEPYSYYILSGMQNKDVDSWMKKNTTRTDSYLTWMYEYLGKTICTYDDDVNGKTIPVQHFYSKANTIFSIGNQNAKKENIGYWTYYYSNGMKKSEGAYGEKNLREGVWKFYAQTGLIKTTENYIGGKIEGAVENFYTNGSIKAHKNFSKSLLEGEQLVYYPTGVRKNSYSYKADVQGGKEIQYHKNGKTEYELNVTDSKYQGDLAQYYMDGHLEQKATFKDGKRIGKYQEFYDLPENAVKQEGNYEKGIITGTFKSYHQNGAVSETGEYNKEGAKTGVWKSFNEDKILISEQTFNNGKNSGTSKEYTNKGKLAEEYIYKNDMLQEYKAYGSDGKIVYQNKKEGKNNYDATLYYPNGNKKREGKVSNGVLDGKWKNYNINGYLTSEENYSAGKKDGKFTSYYENGNVKREIDYIEGESNGYYKEYYKNGKVKKEGAYIKDKQVGVWTSYFSDGTTESINFYKDDSYDNWQQYFCANGKMDFEDFVELDYIKKRLTYDSTGKAYQESNFDKGTGILDIKYPNGKQNRTTTFKDDLKQGISTSYFGNGKLSVTQTYKDNLLNGEVKYYFPSGKIKTEENYANGDLHGKVVNYYENGNIRNSSEYIYGKRNGKCIYYFPNKQIEIEYNYKDNNLDGKTTQYNESGDVMIIKIFEEDVLISYQYYDKTGQLIAPIELKNETGAIKAFYKSGSPSVEYNIKNGAVEGKRTMYYTEGKVSDETIFSCDEKEGKRKSFFKSGKLKAEESWKADDKSGDFVYYYENGKVKSHEYYLNDRKFGAFKNFDETGKLIKTYFYYDDELLAEK